MSKVDSPVGKQMLAYAMNRDEDVVLEFSENEQGEKVIMDITDHVSALEEAVSDDEVSGSRLR